MSSTSETTATHLKKSQPLNTYPLWSPRFWHGMRLRAYWGLMRRNRFRVEPFRWGMAVIIVFCAVLNSTLYRLQWLIYGRRIRDTTIDQPPLFIIGHWRSGTTHLHELLVRDDRFSFPTTYECFAPYHFLVSGWILPKLLWFLLPSKRPMDNMPTGFDRPQEDEFALCTMGAPTPYCRMAFPNNPEPYGEFLNMKQTDLADLRRFKECLVWFVKCLTLKSGKRIVLKSPPHTGRIALLAELFPGAQFIHLARNPDALFPSTRRTWEALDVAQAFQRPQHHGLDEYILSCHQRMYEGYREQLPQLDPAQICELHYEDLARDPIGQVEALYKQLDLGEFEYVRPRLEQYVAGQKDYRRNVHQLDPEIKAQVDRRWAWYIERYGYQES